MRQTDSSSNRLLSFATSWLLCARWIAETNPKDVGDIPFVSGILSPSRTFLQLHHLIISPPFSIIPLMQRVTRETRDSRETRGVVCLPALFASRSGISARNPPPPQSSRGEESEAASRRLRPRPAQTCPTQEVEGGGAGAPFRLRGALMDLMEGRWEEK